MSDLDDSNLTRWSGSRREPSVARHKCAIESLGEGNVERVIWGEVGTQLVGASQKPPSWMPDDWEKDQVIYRGAEEPICNPVRKPVPA